MGCLVFVRHPLADVYLLIWILLSLFIWVLLSLLLDDMFLVYSGSTVCIQFHLSFDVNIKVQFFSSLEICASDTRC